MRRHFDKSTALVQRSFVMSVNVRLSGFDFRSEHIRGIQRTVAKVFGMRVVPPRGLIVRHAKDDGVAHDRRRECGNHQTL